MIRSRVITTVAAAAVLFHCGASDRARAATEIRWCGDLTEDGVTTAADALEALRRVINASGERPFDYNCDEHTTLADALVLLKSAVGDSVDVFCDPACETQAFRFRETTTTARILRTGDAWGLAWGDVDGDGWPDLWLGNHTQWPVIYRNNGNGSFSDVTATVFPDAERADRHGATWADFDADGDQDLFVSVGSMGENTPNQLLVNDGGVLADGATDRGVAAPLSRGRAGLWFDWNLDRHLDLLVLNERRPDALFPSALYEQQADGRFLDISEPVGLDIPVSSRFAQLCDVSGDSLPELIIDGGRFPQRIYTLDGAPFVDLTSNLGFSPRIEGVRDAVVADFDNDLRNDIFLLRRTAHSEVRIVGHERVEVFIAITPVETEHGVSFATEGPVGFSFTGSHPIPLDEIFIGRGGAHPASRDFVLSPHDPAARGQMAHVPGVDRGIYVGFDAGGVRAGFSISVPQGDFIRRTFNVVAVSTGIAALETAGFEPKAQPLAPKLFMFRRGKFIETTVGSGLEEPVSCLSAAAGDFDNDGDVDLYLACAGSIQNYPNRMYLNDGQGRFAPVPDAAGAQGASRGLADSVAVADYDRDGFLDLAVTNGRPLPPFSAEGRDQLLKNGGNANHWLEIDLGGTASNIDAIGARLELTAGGVTQVREVGCDVHLYSQNHRRVHFGLGSTGRVDSLKVHWPSGAIEEFSELESDTVVRLVEAKR